MSNTHVIAPTRLVEPKTLGRAIPDPKKARERLEVSAEEFDALIAAVIDEAAEDYCHDPELTVFHALDGEGLVFSAG